MECRVAGASFLVPAIVDDEVRRELIRIEATAQLARLNGLREFWGYQPHSTVALRRADRFWTTVRKTDRPTADRHALDGDMVLAAQATLLAANGAEVIVATTTTRDLAPFVDVRDGWTIA